MKTHVHWKHYAAKNFYVSRETCDFCGVPFKFGKDCLASHIKDVHKLSSGNCTYCCPCCYYRTGELKTLKMHLRMRHSWIPMMPPSHRPEHRAKFKEICDICGLILGNRKVLINHKLGQHGMDPKDMSEYNGEKILECERGDECGGFRTLLPERLKEHLMKKHGAEKKWKCETCGKGFTDSGKLKRHMDIHKNKGLRPYQCEICGNSVKKNNKKNNFNLVLRILIVDFFGLQFAVKNYLYIHKRLSHQNRPFASTNKKRTTKRGRSGVVKTSTEDTQGSSEARAAPTSTQFAIADKRMEDGGNFAMDIN